MRTGSRTRRRILLVATAGTVALIGSGVAYAYWTTSGSGAGTASVSADAGTLTLHASTTGLLAPGTSVPVTFTVDNPGTAALHVATVHLQGVTADSAHAGCDTADFSMADVVGDQTIAAKSVGVALTSTGSLAYADTAVDQSACKGATLTLQVTSN